MSLWRTSKSSSRDYHLPRFILRNIDQHKLILVRGWWLFHGDYGQKSEIKLLYLRTPLMHDTTFLSVTVRDELVSYYRSSKWELLDRVMVFTNYYRQFW